MYRQSSVKTFLTSQVNYLKGKVKSVLFKYIKSKNGITLTKQRIDLVNVTQSI